MTMNNCITFNCKVLGYIDGIGGRVPKCLKWHRVTDSCLIWRQNSAKLALQNICTFLGFPSWVQTWFPFGYLALNHDKTW